MRGAGLGRSHSLQILMSIPTLLLRRAALVVLALSLGFGLAACDSGGEEVVVPPVVPPPVQPPPVQPPPGPTAASFPIASQVVAFGDGSQGLVFAVTPVENVRLVRVDIRNPLGTTATFNANNNVALGGMSFALQDPGFAYFRVSGAWSFTFIGATEPAGTAFTVAVPLNVGARPAPEGRPSEGPSAAESAALRAITSLDR